MEPSSAIDYLNPRDSFSHGTHVAATAAGTFVEASDYMGLAEGTIRGGAPKARLAIYKVCWQIEGEEEKRTGKTKLVCPSVSMLKGFDEAIRDGVDVINLSVGSTVQDPLSLEVDKTRNPAAIGSFHAIAKGIPVICAAGNTGPAPYTVVHTAPWVASVAASTIDRVFLVPITLGGHNNKTLVVIYKY